MDDFAARFDVSRETLSRLQTYHALLLKWNRSINLVSRKTLQETWTRHFVDSAQIYSVASGENRKWVDLGSGGGFPGLVVAIMAHELSPDLEVTCIESDQRKAAFLNTVIRETGIRASVLTSRIEEAPPQNADIVSARALASLRVLLEFSERHLKPGGEAVFLKGAAYQKEATEALEMFTFKQDTYPSATSSEATIVRIGDIQRV
ncbi:MAG: 16S rRNA (guanine(527)-N(7))-methyltransferase RsmG [Rhodobacterales bacterium]|nr:MAG: 16S rRNA (guanine(527)-N(7))-methyltransferase RsmG [Rhodobacterales bacterium]